MFEVLLQADKALASGALDQAERSYWQLVELDPTNAIAVAGLARVSLERGDKRLARTFADRALAMDPESVAAKRILEALKGGEKEAPGPKGADLPLLAAQRLEALGRRRAAAAEDEAGSAPDPGGKPAKRGKSGVDDAGKPLPQLPDEPLPERRQAGRQAAAAAAAKAEAAPRTQAPLRPKTHQALGDRARRHLLPEDVTPQPWAGDPFAAAESAAAIEAVDETDDVIIEEHAGRRARAGQPSGATDRAGEADAATFDAIDAQGEDESIAMRVALLADAAQLEAAARDAAQEEAAEMDAARLDTAGLDTAEMDAAELEAAAIELAEFDEGVLGVAELVAAEELGPASVRPIDLAALEADLQAAELRIAEREAGEREAASGAADAEAALAAAELASAELATAQLASEQIAEAELEAAELDIAEAPHWPPALRKAHPGTADEANEEDAEAAALREAMADVLGGDGGNAGDSSGVAEAGDAAEDEARERARPPAGSRPTTPGKGRPSTPEPPTGHDTPGKPAAEGAGPADSEAIAEPRRRGLLRRLRGD